MRVTAWRRVAPPLLVGALPAVLLSLGVARYILNHFFADAPYLLDSGLLSGLAYRSGLLMAPPPITGTGVTSFYQIYVSPIISLASLLSYLIPVQRIEWFAFVEAMVFFPLGIAVYALARRIEPGGLVRRLPAATLAALAFALSGLVLWMIGYPHYEAAIPGLICLVLVSLVTGRTPMTWILIALAASVRQDGGLHVALAIAPLVYLRWRGVEMLPGQRRLIAAMAVAIGLSVAAIASQRLWFVPIDRLHPVYLGTPAYAHVTPALLVGRMRAFLAFDKVIYYPFVATLVIAAMRRDARYLLGWAAAAPWFAFNLLAFDEAKSSFIGYAAGPFVVSMFWIYLYGGVLAPASRRLRPWALEVVVALVCASSTLGSYRAAPVGLTAVAREMAVSQPRSRASVHAFVDALRVRHADLGRLYVDSAVAAIALESLEWENFWQPGAGQSPDTLVFHDRVAGGDRMLSDLVEHRLDACVHVLRTHLFACSRAPLPTTTFAGIPTEAIPAVFAFTRVHRPGIRLDPPGLTLLGGHSLDGFLGPLAHGTYEWTMTVTAEEAPAGPGRLQLVIEAPGGATRARFDAPAGSRAVALRFEADGQEALWFRIEPTSPISFQLSDVRLRRVEPRGAFVPGFSGEPDRVFGHGTW